MPVPRPLPPRPSLEFEHKAAKTLLRRLRAGDPDALARARARHPAVGSTAPVRLADAQRVIAREYGFASWPRLVRYFGDLDRQRLGGWRSSAVGRELHEGRARALLAEHRDRRTGAGRTFAAYVPRFYGMRVDEVFAATVTEDDARLCVARANGFPSWEVLLDADADETARRQRDAWDEDPIRHASTAIASADLDALRRVVEAHPDLLHPTEQQASRGRSLMRTALQHERTLGVAAMRPIVDWLVEQGLDRQRELDVLLTGHMSHRTVEKVRWLLDRGADPNWIAPNGIPVLEHALLRYWNGEIVDLIAERAAPRRALWISAGLGDVEGVRRSLDARGKPIPDACRLRPDWDAIGGMTTMPSLPDPDDEELLMEALLVAALNGRTAVIEYMASRGAPLNSLVYGMPIAAMATGNGWPSVVESLVRCGADLDLRGWRPTASARELAREMFEQRPDDPGRRRIVELCGLDPAVIIAERDARPVPPPGPTIALEQALALAGDDAFRLGQPDIRPDNLLVGLMRAGGPAASLVARARGLDVDRFRADLQHRLRPADDRVERPTLPMHPAAQAAIELAMATATERRRETVGGQHLLHALTRDERGAAAELLARYGSSAAIVNAEAETLV